MPQCWQKRQLPWPDWKEAFFLVVVVVEDTTTMASQDRSMLCGGSGGYRSYCHGLIGK